MTDDQLAEWLGLGPDERGLVANISPDKRAAYERMAQVYDEIVLWEAGVGKKPNGVILCGKRQVRGAGRE